MSRVSNFTLSGFLFGLIVFATITGLVLNFSGDLFSTYNQDVDSSSLAGTSQKLTDEVSKDINSTREAAGQVEGSIAAGVFFIPALAGMVTTTVGAISLVPTMLNDLSSVIPGGAPQEIQLFLYGFVVIGLGFAVWRLYTGGA